MDIRRILCPTDFSEASAHAVEQAAAIAGWYKARITALHAVSPPLMAAAEAVGPAADDASALDVEAFRRGVEARFASSAATARRAPGRGWSRWWP